ncbi:lysozyme family protein [Sporolactobacillus shoreicorticis]|uniref:Lysozyme family protein n=1 Tax=Sporolactobacillus shoreicorticis TaxID=1923877 RepID=A0ABW5S5K7_9BACL|nr:lysozyme family protein [Sporolactobacillus shoreicorticis]MCO7126689.1 lysozyme family protein [Sporolactobacillus shoreicorticis]
MTKIIKLIVSSSLIIAISFVLLYIISSMYSPQAEHVPLLNDQRVISPEVEQYRPIIAQTAKANGVEQYTDIIMAIAMQESKGKAVDVMQASESLGMPRNSITSPKKSIQAGTHYFKKALIRSNGNLELALQSYNFGLGFVDYVKARGGKYTPQLARQFSEEKSKKLNWANYGDPKYVEHVMRYYTNEKQKRALTKKKN